MLINISEGEIIDRLSILEIKKHKINDPIKLIEVNKELQSFDSYLYIKHNYAIYYELMYNINNTIWNITDDIKINTELNNIYAEKSFYIFELNQQRFRIKNIINKICESKNKEQKSYKDKIIYYYLNKSLSVNEISYNLIYLILHYDHVVIVKNEYISEYISILNTYFPSVGIIEKDSVIDITLTENIDIKDNVLFNIDIINNIINKYVL